MVHLNVICCSPIDDLSWDVYIFGHQPIWCVFARELCHHLDQIANLFDILDGVIQSSEPSNVPHSWWHESLTHDGAYVDNWCLLHVQNFVIRQEQSIDDSLLQPLKVDPMCIPSRHNLFKVRLVESVHMIFTSSIQLPGRFQSAIMWRLFLLFSRWNRHA